MKDYAQEMDIRASVLFLQMAFFSRRNQKHFLYLAGPRSGIARRLADETKLDFSIFASIRIHLITLAGRSSPQSGHLSYCAVCAPPILAYVSPADLLKPLTRQRTQ
jgi:hypothetical protein